MGWASGGNLFVEVWDAVHPHIPKKRRVEVAKVVISAFEDCDWDTQDEARDQWPEVDQALRELHPDWGWDEDEEEEEPTDDHRP